MYTETKNSEDKRYHEISEIFRSLAINEQLMILGRLKEICIDNHKEHMAKYENERDGFVKLLNVTREDYENLISGNGKGLTQLYKEAEMKKNY